MACPAEDLRPCLALTPGEPAGIGPELAVLLAAEDLGATLVHFADPRLLHDRATAIGAAVQIVELADATAVQAHRRGVMQVVPVPLSGDPQPGRIDPSNAAYVLACLNRALEACRPQVIPPLPCAKDPFIHR